MANTKQTENLAECGNKSKPLLQAVFLTPYLTYRLKGQVFQYKIDRIKNRYEEMTGIEMWQEKNKYWGVTTKSNSRINLCSFKPILIPISDFYDINAPAFIDTNFDIPTQLVLVDLCTKKQHYSGIKYSDMQEFLREHIDVFNLIEQDLAVSIHDVVSCPKIR